MEHAKFAPFQCEDVLMLIDEDSIVPPRVIIVETSSAEKGMG